ncbi:MAG: hypothetical protein AVDCRST_MAG73-1884 [uncultured Thermomicrobiales bacterium]|uniref:Uncharacterized protein n=1 Tax=uncultured Thermomicrobiales bacterium TaxID=1645740 RepID=A0A6J4U4Y2_9BACT|nr:MAG: hypothetical protein AVDCRST_MAG73-1884 [uncultured Thermomicrobiales bacterium]
MLRDLEDRDGQRIDETQTRCVRVMVNGVRSRGLTSSSRRISTGIVGWRRRVGGVVISFAVISLLALPNARSGRCNDGTGHHCEPTRWRDRDRDRCRPSGIRRGAGPMSPGSVGGQPGLSQLSGPERPGSLRGRDLRRVPAIRAVGDRTAVPVRVRPLVHRVRVFERPPRSRHRHPRTAAGTGDARRRQHRRPARPGNGAALRPRPGLQHAATGESAEGVRQDRRQPWRILHGLADPRSTSAPAPFGTTPATPGLPRKATTRRWSGRRRSTSGGGSRSG